MDCTITHIVNILGENLEIDFNVEFHIENDGIGSYEYGGSSGYHSGSDYPVIENIDWDADLYDTWQNAEIKKLSNTENLINELQKKIKL